MKICMLFFIAVLLVGCRVKRLERVEKKERLEVEFLRRDSVDVRELYQRLQDRVVRVKRVEWTEPDSLGRQYKKVETAVVVEEGEREEAEKVLVGGSVMEGKVERQESVKVRKSEERKVLSCFRAFIFFALILGVGIFIIYKRRRL